MNDSPNRTRRALLGFGSNAQPGPPTALIGTACLCNTQVLCESCRDICESRAIRWERALGRAPQPRIVSSACTGCGDCVSVCPTGAISLTSGDA